MFPQAWSRRRSAAVLAAWVVGLTLVPISAANAAPPALPQHVGTRATTVAPHAAGNDLALHGDTARPARQSRTGESGARVRRASYAWKGRRITYYENIPSQWDWSLRTAVAKWNSAGGGIRFARTSVRSRAQLTIGYGNTGSAAGMATVGRTPRAWVRLSAAYKNVDALDAHRRIEVMAVLTHELGHVLGFEHTRARCSLMSPVLDVNGCAMVPDAHPGYYRCRTIDAPLVARFVRLYGGRARQPRGAYCLIAALPSALPSVVFSGDPSAPVTISWARPDYVPGGSLVVVRHWAADGLCGVPPTAAGTEYAGASSGYWQGADADNCYRVQLVNRYGAGRAPVGAAMNRTLALQAPVQGVAPVQDVAPVPSDLTGGVPSDLPGAVTGGGDVTAEPAPAGLN